MANTGKKRPTTVPKTKQQALREFDSAGFQHAVKNDGSLLKVWIQTYEEAKIVPQDVLDREVSI
jgi:hypothetical protein